MTGSRGIGACLGFAAVWILLACSDPPPSRGGAEPGGSLPVIMVPEGGHAIAGYDPVSYFLEGRPAKGQPAFSHRWRDATWLFASAAHRDLFASDPAKYAPAYGGWCAYGLAEGYAAETDPVNAWTLHRGKLYLNWDAEVAADWRREPDAFLEKSDANWPEVRRSLQDGSAEIYWHDDE